MHPECLIKGRPVHWCAHHYAVWSQEHQCCGCQLASRLIHLVPIVILLILAHIHCDSCLDYVNHLVANRMIYHDHVYVLLVSQHRHVASSIHRGDCRERQVEEAVKTKLNAEYTLTINTCVPILENKIPNKFAKV